MYPSCSCKAINKGFLSIPSSRVLALKFAENIEYLRVLFRCLAGRAF